MEVFTVSQTDKLEFCVVDGSGASHHNEIAIHVGNGTLDLERYRRDPLVVRLVSHHRGSKSARLKRSDALLVGVLLVLRRSVLETSAGEILRQNCDVLPVGCDDADACLVLPRSRLAALDETRSNILRLPSGPAYSVTRAVFDPERIGDIAVFRTVTVPGLIYVTGALRDSWHSCGLVGMDFRKEWASHE